MSVQLLIDIFENVLSCATLVLSSFPLVMMPLRIVQAYRDEVKIKLDHCKDTDDVLFMWMIYAWLVVGIVFSLYQLGFVCYHFAIAVGSACMCLLALLCLLCSIFAAIYIRVGEWRRKNAKDMQMEG